MIKHIVLVTFKTGVTQGQIAEIKKRLAALPALIPEIKTYDFGLNINPVKSYDFILVSEFSDMEAVGRYKVQPDHAAAARFIQDISDEMKILDFEF
jgi:hypothetical protein